MCISNISLGLLTENNCDFQILIMCWQTIKPSYAKDHLDFVVRDMPVHPIITAGIGEGAPRNSSTGLCYIEN